MTKLKTKKEWALEQKLPEESLIELVTRLNLVSEQPNPVAITNILVPIDLKEVRKSVTDAEAFTVLNSNLWGLTLQALRISDLDAVKGNMAAMIAGGALSAASAKKLEALLGKTIPDPTYSATIKTSSVKAAGYDSLTIGDLI